MNTRDKVRNIIMWVACILAWSTAFVMMFALGQKHGRDQVYLKEVECVTHPLKQNKVLCKKARTTEELEIQWKS
jgi:hypothetical protein